MFTLTFLVCYTMTGQCVGVGPQQIFRDTTQCEIFAEALMAENMRKADEGEMAPHVAQYKCVSWGTPT